MVVYLAGQYARRDEFRGYVDELAKHGVTVNSRWLQEQEPLNSNMGDHSVEFYKKTSTIDLEDIDNADAILFFSEDPTVGVVRGGRHVEFGYALGKGIPIYVVGFYENVFHYHKNVKHFGSLDKFYEYCGREKVTTEIVTAMIANLKSGWTGKYVFGEVGEIW